SARGAPPEKAATLPAADEFRPDASARRSPREKGARFPGLAGSLSGALRDPRAVAEIRRRSIRAATRGPGVRHRASRGRYRAQPHPHLLPPGAPEIARKG